MQKLKWSKKGVTIFWENFFIKTDQRSLKELMDQVIQTPAQQYYLSKLLGYAYAVLCIPGKSNIVVDALLRREIIPKIKFLLLTTLVFEFSKILL